MAAAGCTDSGSTAPSPEPTSPAAPASTITWTDCRLEGAPGALVRAVAAGGDGAPWTAVGQEGGAGSDTVRPAVWTSPDGCEWRRARVVPITPDGQRTGFSAVSRRGRLVAALGRSYSQVHGNIRPTLWRSDGVAPLREVELPRELFGGPRSITMDGLVALPQFFLATGGTSGRTATLLCTSGAAPTARDWIRLPPGREQSSGRAEQLLPRDIAAGAGGSLIVGTSFQVSGDVPGTPRRRLDGGSEPTCRGPGWPGTATSGWQPPRRSGPGTSRLVWPKPAAASSSARPCRRTGSASRPAARCPASRYRPVPRRSRTSLHCPAAVPSLAPATAGGRSCGSARMAVAGRRRQCPAGPTRAAE
jgi:hypothetical protein